MTSLTLLAAKVGTLAARALLHRSILPAAQSIGTRSCTGQVVAELLVEPPQLVLAPEIRRDGSESLVIWRDVVHDPFHGTYSQGSKRVEREHEYACRIEAIV